VADVLFGGYNPAGRLPVTFYRNLQQLPDYEDYRMAGRTYRYLKEKPLFPFGFGLSYAQFEYLEPNVCGVSDADDNGEPTAVQLEIPVRNTSRRDGEEVVQVYVRRGGDTEGPRYALRAFRRVPIKAGATVPVSFRLDREAFRTFSDETGRMEFLPGEYEVLYGPSSDEEALHSVTVKF
jgi:beta-glucosidase